MQSEQDLRAAYASICSLHERGVWRPGPIRNIGLRLTSMDGPSEAGLAALGRLLRYARTEIGIDFDVQGGGAGCFDVVLGADDGDPQAVENAILSDTHFQTLLAEFNVHLSRLRLPAGSRAYAGFIPIKAGLVTNRQPSAQGKPTEPVGALGSDFTDQLNFALVEFHILDLKARLEKSAMLKRIWRRINLQLGDIRERRFQSEVARLDFVAGDAFTTLLETVPSKGILLSIHGYANGFESSMASFSKFLYRTGLDRLDHFPILFGWPSEQNPLGYLPQSRVALNCRSALADTIEMLGATARGRQVSVIAHSHGNDMLVAVARDRANANKTPRLDHCVFVEPDVDAQYLSREIDLIMQATERLTIYHSENDRALAIAGALFQDKRAGQIGVQFQGRQLGLEAVEVIDATDVAAGFMKHAPHVDAIEVIYDIRDAIEGRGPEARTLLPGLTARAWRIKPVR